MQVRGTKKHLTVRDANRGADLAWPQKVQSYDKGADRKIKKKLKEQSMKNGSISWIKQSSQPPTDESPGRSNARL